MWKKVVIKCVKPILLKIDFNRNILQIWSDISTDWPIKIFQVSRSEIYFLIVFPTITGIADALRLYLLSYLDFLKEVLRLQTIPHNFRKFQQHINSKETLIENNHIIKMLIIKANPNRSFFKKDLISIGQCNNSYWNREFYFADNFFLRKDFFKFHTKLALALRSMNAKYFSYNEQINNTITFVV